MGLVYAHWRPDTNECFYVGASRDAEDTRPYEYDPRNKDYATVVAILRSNGLEPFTKVIWNGLVYECTGTYERMRIAYQKAILGDKLTNKSLGGFGFYLSSEMNRKLQLEAQNRPEVNAKRSASLIEANTRPEVIARRSDAAARAHERPEVAVARVAREKDPVLNAKRKQSAKLGGLAASQKPKEELRARGQKAAKTREHDKLLSAVVVSVAILGAI